jgi:hypothetical protein
LKCPNCKKSSIAEILWGYILLTPEGERNLEEKKIVLGGCIVTDNDPKWECTECYHRWGERDE